MRVKIWGTRGSRPVSGNNSYGNDTSCIEVSLNDGTAILLDAGSGLSAYAKENPHARPVICISHTHLDHIQGLPFYDGLFASDQVIYTPDVDFGSFFNGALSPLRRDELPADVRRAKAGDKFTIGSALVECAATNHPGGCLAYKITADGWTFVYGGDHEIPLNAETNLKNDELMRFIAGADVALLDAHFSSEDHAAHPGWGHSDMTQWLTSLTDKNVGQLVFTHFNPDYSDAQIDNLLQKAKQAFPEMNIAAARQGCMINQQGLLADNYTTGCKICDFFKNTACLYDTHAVLNALLTRARQITRADAGTIYLLENNELTFAAAQNDTLFPKSAANKFSYMNARIPVSKSSIAGYVAATGASLNIPDVYELSSTEYGFNRDFDQKNGYRTGSMLVVPLLNGKKRLVGVLQLINSQTEDRVAPFTLEMEQEITALAEMSTIPLERSFMVIGMIERMLKTSALRDPSETAGHVYRVGGIAAELYHSWAEKHGIDPEELLATKGQLRLAAMLHDVGKVGIPDAVLKKPGKLDDAERAKMQEHAALGAHLFEDGNSEIDQMAREIALHHHAKWDGSGYTGDPNCPSPAGEDIPLWARITAIADVYDALVSTRCYKPGWEPAKALEILHKDAGSHFDPELVQCFSEITDTVNAIMQRYGN